MFLIIAFLVITIFALAFDSMELRGRISEQESELRERASDIVFLEAQRKSIERFQMSLKFTNRTTRYAGSSAEHSEIFSKRVLMSRVSELVDVTTYADGRHTVTVAQVRIPTIG